jgi:predicted outer membrane protein
MYEDCDVVVACKQKQVGRPLSNALTTAAVKMKLRQKLSVKQSASRSQTKLSDKRMEQQQDNVRSSQCEQRNLVQQRLKGFCYSLEARRAIGQSGATR